jgi:hypothetical protein
MAVDAVVRKTTVDAGGVATAGVVAGRCDDAGDTSAEGTPTHRRAGRAGRSSPLRSTVTDAVPLMTSRTPS